MPSAAWAAARYSTSFGVPPDRRCRPRRRASRYALAPPPPLPRRRGQGRGSRPRVAHSRPCWRGRHLRWVAPAGRAVDLLAAVATPRPTIRRCGLAPRRARKEWSVPCHARPRRAPCRARRAGCGRRRCRAGRRHRPGSRPPRNLDDRADDLVLGFQQHLVIGGVGDRAAGGQRGQPRAAPAAQHAVDRVVMNEAAPRRPRRVLNPSASIATLASKSARGRSR